MESKKKNILLGTLIVGIVSMSIAFAALTTRLTINGTANVAATKWNIRFENWVKANPATAGGHTNTAVSPEVNELTMQDNSNVTKVSGINVSLNQPGDIAKYTFEIANRGTIAAKLDNFTVTDTSENNLVGYEVKCYDQEENGNEITTNYVLGVEQKVYCYLVVSYKDQTNSQTPGQSQIYSQDPVSTSISASWTWTQADSSNNNSGNEQSGGNIQTDPTAGFDKFYTSSQTSGGPTLPTEAQIWVQENTSTGEKEVCGKENGITKCITNDSNGRLSQFAKVNGQWTADNGYILEKKTEFEAIDGINCSVNSNYEGKPYLACTSSSLYFGIDHESGASCFTSDYMKGCNLYANGSSECF